MVKHHIEHQADSPFASLGDKFFHIGHCTISRINIIIIFYVITIVILRRYKEWGRPDVIRTQLFYIIQFTDYASDISKPILVCITK